MNRRTLIVLAVLAVVAAALAGLGQRGQQQTAAGLTGQTFLPSLAAELDAADRITIAGGDGTQTTLRQQDGGWVVAEQDGYPADVARLRADLLALVEAAVVEEKTSNPAFYDRLGVQAPDTPNASGTAVTVAAGDRTIADIVLGAESGADGRFARERNAATSVLIDRNPSFDPDPAQWLVPDLLDIRGNRVARIDIEHADGERLTITKPSVEAGGFTVLDMPAGRELQYASVANVTGNALRELRLEAARAAPATDGDPQVTTRFVTFDGLTVTVDGWRIDGDDWITIEAAADTDIAAPTDDGESVTGETAAPADAESRSNAQTEAAAINARVAGWAFRIPSHIYDQMTRRLEDLLKAPESD